MSTISAAYNEWSATYDDMTNPTRDLDATAIRTVLEPFAEGAVLELGCGTGKNTAWLETRATRLVSVDFSEGMLEKARTRLAGSFVTFQQADITRPLPFPDASFGVATCNLVLEHIADLAPVFAEISRVLAPGGRFFLSELHPFKQYSGSKARFEKDGQTQVVDCHLHHVSDYLRDAGSAGLQLERLDEWFDDGARAIPRLLTLLFRKR
ncbi:MAG: class SAM-dependent methyltransferase [Flaviaesturariibacter sp.]|nr:class SAM-dependent methyltransferase [Flaviaesturariibacter sp.]